MDDFGELTESQQRLDAMLDTLGDDGMLLGELDGFLCGVVCGPNAIEPEEWLPLVLDASVDLPATGQAELANLVLARHDEIVAEFAADGYQPLYEIDPINDDVLWGIWLSGFELAMGLRIEAWEKLIKSRKESQAQEAALAIVSLLAASDPDLPQIGIEDPEFIAFQQDAPQIIPEIATILYRAHRLAVPQSPIHSANVGRNDPCPCGSGLKYKRCHGKV